MEFRNFIKTAEYLIITIGIFLSISVILAFGVFESILVQFVTWVLYLLVNAPKVRNWLRNKVKL